MGSVTVTPGASQPLQTEQPQNTATIPQQQPQPAPVATQAPAVHPAVAKDALFGRAAKMLMGSSTSYQVDPQSGQTVATQTPNKPGAFFKNILNAAILGGAAAEEAHNKNPYMGFGGGAVSGGAGAIQDARRQDILKRQQAQEQFNNQQKAAQEQREQQGFDTEQQVRKAQIAQANAETYRTNVLTQGDSLKQHTDVAAIGQQHFSDYDKAGLQPVVKDVPETEMQDMIKHRKGGASLDWEATGVKMGTGPGPDGTTVPTYEYTYTAYDPKGKVPVSKGTIDQWKKDGMDKYNPELFNILKPGKELDISQYIELKKTDEKLFNNGLARQKVDLDTQEGQARLHLTNAETAHALAETRRSNQEIADAALGKKQSEQFGLALQDLDEKKGDFNALKPSSRVVIAESMDKMVAPLTAQYKQVAADTTDPDQQQKLKDIYTQIQNLTSLGTQAMKGLGQQPGATQPGQIPAGATIAVNPKTGAKVYSTDGGKNWIPVPGAATEGPKTIPIPSNAMKRDVRGGAETEYSIDGGKTWQTPKSHDVIPPGAQTKYDPKTNATTYSTDGGKTWVPAQTTQVLEVGTKEAP